MAQLAKVKETVAVEPNTSNFRGFEKLKAIIHDKRFTKKSAIYCEGDPCEYLFFIKKGTVKLSKVSDDGMDLTLHFFYPGDLFGEYNGADQHPANFFAEAVTDCTIGCIHQEELNAYMAQDGDLAVEFSKWLSGMQWYTQIKLRDILFHGKNGALASTLLRAVNTYGVELDGAIHITRKFTNYELANLIGATRETVNRMLSQFQKDGLIDHVNGRLTILNVEELKKICHCEGCPLSICRL